MQQSTEILYSYIYTMQNIIVSIFTKNNKNNEELN